MAKSRLHAVYELGQSIWYDNIRRGVITSGELQRLIDDDAVVGITSNPTIFEKAIDGSTDYDDALRALVRQGITEGSQVFEALSIEDIQMAADVLRPIFDRTNHVDGYISLEVTPGAANDTQATIAEVRHLFTRANRPNVFIKIPATPAGIPAIEQMIYEGVNINITLIFALEVYEQVTQAYIRGLEHRLRDGLPVRDIASVASFFVSRVDTLVDKLLEDKIKATSDSAEQQKLKALEGKAAIANARLVYQEFKRIFHAPRFETLKHSGAHVQRPLWASTSTKNPAYRDVLYAEELIGPDTVDTMPLETIENFRDHGRVGLTIENNLPQAHTELDALEQVGIHYHAVTQQLQDEGVQKFADSFHELFNGIAEKQKAIQAQVAR